MARIRTLKPEFWEDEKVGGLSVLDRLNFIGLTSLADDEGRGCGAVDWLKSRLHPYDKTLRRPIIEASLRKLEDVGVVVFYEIDGQRFYQVINFTKHQKIDRKTPSKFP